MSTRVMETSATEPVLPLERSPAGALGSAPLRARALVAPDRSARVVARRPRRTGRSDTPPNACCALAMLLHRLRPQPRRSGHRSALL